MVVTEDIFNMIKNIILQKHGQTGLAANNSEGVGVGGWIHLDNIHTIIIQVMELIDQLMNNADSIDKKNTCISIIYSLINDSNIDPTVKSNLINFVDKSIDPIINIVINATKGMYNINLSGIKKFFNKMSCQCKK